MQSSFQRKDYATIGRLHARRNPTDAQSLIEGYRASHSRAFDTDLTNLNYYFSAFCKINDVDTGELTGPLYADEKTDKRRLFIACMICIYAPEILQYGFPNTLGLYRAVCRLLAYDEGNTNKVAKEAIEWMRHGLYGFMEDVQETTEQLIQYKREQAA